MADFEWWEDYDEFARFVKTEMRHLRDAKTQAFLDAALRTAMKRKRILEARTALWRAQLGHEFGRYCGRTKDGYKVTGVTMKPLNANRMKPLSDRAYEGRINVKGIPCLYLANEMATAMTEVRPWVGSHVSIAQFVTLRDLILVDCSSDTEVPYMGNEDPASIEHYVWWNINEAFSEPVTRADDVADYAPTQVLAETFRSGGADGLLYGSRFGKGKNIALFDLDAAEQTDCKLYQVEGVTLKFKEIADPY